MTGDWRRLAQVAARRRAELDLTQAQVAERGPLSLDRVQAIEGAKRKKYRLSTLLALERALAWDSGSVERVLDGNEPIPLGGVQKRPSVEVREPSAPVKEHLPPAYRDVKVINITDGDEEFMQVLWNKEQPPKDLEAFRRDMLKLVRQQLGLPADEGEGDGDTAEE